MRGIHLRTGLLLVFCALAPQFAFGQAEVGARLFGAVTDPSGDAVHGAEVKIVNSATGLTRSVVTAQDGIYVAPQIPAGSYEIDVVKPGFAVEHITGIVVRTNESVRRNIQMSIGAVATRIEVSGAAELTNVYTAQLSQTVDSRRVQDLPLNGRDVTQLALTVAGATVVDTSTAFYAGTSGFTATHAVINGNRSQDNVYMLDGMTNMYMERKASNLYPNPDAIEEFTLNTSQYSAEMGGNPGGQLSARTKGGTNALHGSLFEFLRNGDLNGRNAFDTLGKNDGLKRNQYGWAVGGPVYIPRIFNGKNKLFWFNSYQSTPVRQVGTPGFHESWTQKEKNGDFSEHLTGKTKQVASPACDGSMMTVDTGAIFDPLTANSRCASPGFTFPNDVIPASRLDPIMKKFLDEHTPTSPFLGYLWPHFTPNPQDEWQIVNRGDYYFRNHQIMGRYLHGRRFGPAIDDTTGKDLLWQKGTNEGGNTTTATSLAITDTWAVSPHFLVTGGFEYLKNTSAVNPHPYRLSWSALGSKIPNDPGCQDLAFTVQGRTGLVSGGTVQIWDQCSTKDTHSWEINNSVKWIRDKHELSVGGNFSRHVLANTAAKQSGGSFVFGSQFTGLGVADAALGLAQTYSATNFGVATGAERSMAALYFQDNYRLTPHLTLNAGLRWDPGLADKDILGYMSWIVPGAQSTRFPNAPPGILYYGDPGTPNGSTFSRWDQLAPRLGFAWDPTGKGKWSIRAGVGGYYGMVISGGDALSPAGSGFLPLATGGITIINPPSIAWPWDAKPYNGQIAIPVPPPSASSAVPVPIGGLARDPHMKSPNVWNYSFTLERAAAGGVLLRAAYVGSRGTHLIGGQEYNMPVFIPGASTISNIQQRRPDPNFGPTSITSSSNDSHYNSLQLTAEKHYAHGLTFLANYTLSKSIDGGSNDIGFSTGYDVQDPRGPWYNVGLSEFDRTHTVNTSLVYDTPKLQGAPRLLRQLLGNWQSSGIVILRSGDPMTPMSSKGNSLVPGTYKQGDRANLVPGVDWQVSGLDRDQKIHVGYFNQAAFTDPPLGSFGNVGRNVIRLAGYADTDLMLARIFPIGDKARLQFRSEFFNALNRVNFISPRQHGPQPFTDVDNPNFGKYAVLGAQDPRTLQFGLKLLF